MQNNLLIIGAGIYGLVAKEIAESMNCFTAISFVDDFAEETPNGIKVIGTTEDLANLAQEYPYMIAAIGNPEIRLNLLNKIESETPCKIATLVSPHAYVSPSAQIMSGTIIEPMAVIHTGCIIGRGSIISAGAVVNHASACLDGVHVDCNAVVAGNTIVPAKTKVNSGEVYTSKSQEPCNTPATPKPHGPIPFDGKEYSFEDGM